MKFKDIMLKMTNPLDDESLLFAILNTKLRRKNCDIRNLNIMKKLECMIGMRMEVLT